jgi:hypothetical protein
VLDATMSDGSHRVIRLATIEDPFDAEHGSWVCDKLKRECEMMNWIRLSTSIPVPEIYAYEVDVTRPYMIAEKCEGKIAGDAFGLFSDKAKVYFSMPLKSLQAE